MENNTITVHINGVPFTVALTKKGAVSKATKQVAELGKVLEFVSFGITEEQYMSAHAEKMPTKQLTFEEFDAWMRAVPVIKCPCAVKAALVTPVVDETSTTEATTNTTIPGEETTMTTETTNTAVPTKEELTAQANAILDNVTKGFSTATDKVKGFSFTGFFAKVKEIKFSDVVDATTKACDAVYNFFTSTKAGKAIATTVYTVAFATTAMTVVGLFTSSTVAAVLGGAAIHVAYDCYKAYKAGELSKSFVAYASVGALVIYPTIAFTAFFTVPYLVAMVSVVSPALAIILLTPGLSVFF